MTVRDLLANSNFNDFELTLNAFNKWQVANCSFKRVVKQFNPLTSTFEPLEVPCGRCDHCVNTRKNEWFSRMWCHSLDYQYVYYVTFTYASPYDADTVGCDYFVRHLSPGDSGQPVRMCIGKHYKEALLHMHGVTNMVFSDNDYNSTNRRTKLPALIVQKHMQNMFKKLRSIAPEGADISYYYCSEYGHKFGHPHHHAIIWSQKKLSYHTIRAAWSRTYCILGDGEVVPYRGHKNVKIFNVPFGHVDYVDLVANGTMANAGIDKDGKCVFGYVCKYLTKKEYNTSQVLDAWQYLPDYIRPCVGDKCLIEDGRKFYDGSVYTKEQFIQAFKPFTRCSTKRAIGKSYAYSRLEDFLSKNFSLPADASGRSIVYPHYFMEITKRKLLPFRIKTTFEGLPTNSLGSVKVAVFDLEFLLEKLSDLHRYQITYADFEDFVLQRCSGDWVDLERRLSFYDVINQIRYRLDFSPPGADERYVGMKYVLEQYNRHTRKYDKLDEMSVNQFYFIYKMCVHKYTEFTDYFKEIAKENKLLFDEFKHKCKLSGIDFGELVKRSDEYTVYRTNSKQLLYETEHLSLEL